MTDTNSSEKQPLSTASQQQSLRKLSIGVATVLLGTGVYLGVGVNPTIASAAANVLNNTGNQKFTSDPTNGQFASSSYTLSAGQDSAAQSDASQAANSNANSVNQQGQSQANSAQVSATATKQLAPVSELGSVKFTPVNGNDNSAQRLAPIQYSRNTWTGKLNSIDLTSANPAIAQFVNNLSTSSNQPLEVVFYDGNHQPVTTVNPQQLADPRQDIDLTYQVRAKASSTADQPGNDRANVQSSAAQSTGQPAVATQSNQGHQSDPADTTQPEVRHVTYTVVDDTTGQTLVEPTILTSGQAGETIPSIVADNYGTIRQNWLGNGYRLDTSKGDGRGYDLLPTVFSANGQPHDNVTIYLVHDQQTATQQVQVPRTTVYIYSNGGGAATADLQRLTFTHKKVVDKVTNKVVSDKWSPKRQNFKDLDVPKIRGFRPNMPAVNDHNIQHNQGPIVKTVIYTPIDPAKPATQNLNYSVVDDSTGDTLVDQAPLASGGSGSPVPETAAQIYEYVRQSWRAQGYRLDTTKANGQGYDNLPERFDDNADVDQNVTVYLTHNQHETLNHQMVSRRILYYFANGEVAHPTNVSQPLQFTEKRLTDAVTDEVTADTWTPAQDFPEVVSPTIAGYQPDKKVVQNTKIDHNHGPITEIVTYIPNQQQLTYSVVDETSGKTLVDKGLLATGGTGTAVGAVAQQNYAQIRDYWLKHGYQLDTTKAGQQGYDTLPAEFASEDHDQNVTICLINPSEEPAPSNNVVLVTDEPSAAQPADETNNQPAHNTVQLVTTNPDEQKDSAQPTNTVNLVETPTDQDTVSDQGSVALVETPTDQETVTLVETASPKSSQTKVGQGSNLAEVTQSNGLMGLAQV